MQAQLQQLFAAGCFKKTADHFFLLRVRPVFIAVYNQIRLNQQLQQFAAGAVVIVMTQNQFQNRGNTSRAISGLLQKTSYQTGRLPLLILLAGIAAVMFLAETDGNVVQNGGSLQKLALLLIEAFRLSQQLCKSIYL